MHIHTRIRLIALTEDSDSPCRFLCMRMCVWIYGVREPGSRTCMHEPVNDNLSGYIGLYWFVFCSILFHKSVMAIQTPFKFTVFVLLQVSMARTHTNHHTGKEQSGRMRDGSML